MFDIFKALNGLLCANVPTLYIDPIVSILLSYVTVCIHIHVSCVFVQKCRVVVKRSKSTKMV